MAFCEIAQRECVFLEDLSDLKGVSTVMRATRSGERAEIADEMETIFSELQDRVQSDCTEKQCGLHRFAVKMALLAAVEERQLDLRRQKIG